MMLKTRDDLVAEVLGQDKRLDAVRARFNRQVRTLYKNYRAQVEALLAKPRTFDKGERLKLAAAQKIADQLSAMLGEAGLDNLIGDYLDEFSELTKRSLKYFSKLDESVNLAGVDTDRLKAYIRFSEENLRNTFDTKLVKPLQETIFQATFGQLSIPDAVDSIINKFSYLSPIQAETAVIDSLVQYERAVTVEKATAVDLNIFIYTGPDDEITSPQCQFLLGIDTHELPGALYVDEISADLHEDLRDNPLIAGGHVNCRHKYMPVTEDFAVSLGFKPRG